MKKISAKGFGLMEVVVGAAIISVAFFALIGALQKTLNIADLSVKNTQAAFLLEEGMEALRSLRDSGWSAKIAPLSASTSYYFYFDAGGWQATTTNIYVDGIFERSFLPTDVFRDANGNIAASGALDPDIKKIIVFVSWKTKTNATTTREASTYLANLFEI
ncbi:MAG: hypothetical protein AAB771_01535 [Patescibacteria group bacterium]